MDRVLKCVDCGQEFTFSVRDQEFYKVHGYVDPKRCFPCRQKKKRRFNNKEYPPRVVDEVGE